MHLLVELDLARDSPLWIIEVRLYWDPIRLISRRPGDNEDHGHVAAHPIVEILGTAQILEPVFGLLVELLQDGFALHCHDHTQRLAGRGIDELDVTVDADFGRPGWIPPASHFEHDLLDEADACLSREDRAR